MICTLEAVAISVDPNEHDVFILRQRFTALVTEQNMAVALLRRAVGFVPYLADISNWLPIPYHFTFLRGERVLGSYRRHLFKIQDAYTLDLTDDPERTLDRRLVLAMAVGMDALQAR